MRAPFLDVGAVEPNHLLLRQAGHIDEFRELRHHAPPWLRTVEACPHPGDLPDHGVEVELPVVTSPLMEVHGEQAGEPGGTERLEPQQA